MAGSSSVRPFQTVLVAILIFAMLLSPILQSEAARVNYQGLGGRVRRPICPACVCCEPARPGGCCKCLCASTSKEKTVSQSGSP